MNITLTQLVPVLQGAIGPVILISGVGLLLLTLSNRFGRMLDRSRDIIGKLSRGDVPPGTEENLRRQVEILQRRARILKLSITLGSVTIFLVGILILALFVGALWKLEMGAFVVAVFCIAILSMIGSIAAFIADMNLSLQAVELDWRLIAKP